MNNDHDARTPAQIAALIETAGVARARLALGQRLALVLLAGASIGSGAAAYLMVMTGVEPTGPAQLLGGTVISLGLALYIVGRTKLFTGGAPMGMAAADGKITLRDRFHRWLAVYLGNAGVVALALARRNACLGGGKP